MRRRDFISSLGKYTVLATSASIATTAVAKSRELAESSVDTVSKQFKSLRDRMENLEGNQKKMTLALMLLAGISTGVDLTLIL